MNLKTWAREITHKLDEEYKDAFEQYLISNSTFAEAAMELIEKFVDEPEPGLAAFKVELLRRVEAGEDPEAVVREECSP